MDYRIKSGLLLNAGQGVKVLVFILMMTAYFLILSWMFNGVETNESNAEDIGVGLGIFTIGTFVLWLHPTMMLCDLVFVPFEKAVIRIQEPHRPVQIPFKIIYYEYYEYPRDPNKWNEIREDKDNLHVYVNENGQQHQLNDPEPKYIPLSEAKLKGIDYVEA
jgi:hypothetical protein